ncbi:MAG: hypothetical protein EXR48_03995 [Dehalococcoidia bacterium]|nr:hypothetical protein [Dehalococcoidia bacterium]
MTDYVSRCTAILSWQVSAEEARPRCTCTIDRIQEQFSLATFQDLAGLNRLTGELPSSLQPITEEYRR